MQCVALRCVALSCEYRQEVPLKRAKRFNNERQTVAVLRRFIRRLYAPSYARSRVREPWPDTGVPRMERSHVASRSRGIIRAALLSADGNSLANSFANAATVMSFFRKSWTSWCIIPDRWHICLGRWRTSNERLSRLRLTVQDWRLSRVSTIVSEMELLCMLEVGREKFTDLQIRLSSYRFMPM